MTKVKMPEPVAYAIFAENGNIRMWSREPDDLPDLDSLGPMRQLITTTQAEAYAAAKVREALEQAIAICDATYEQGDSEYRDSGCNPYFEGGRDAAGSIETKIRALIK